MNEEQEPSAIDWQSEAAKYRAIATRKSKELENTIADVSGLMKDFEVQDLNQVRELLGKTRSDRERQEAENKRIARELETASKRIQEMEQREIERKKGSFVRNIVQQAGVLPDFQGDAELLIGHSVTLENGEPQVLMNGKVLSPEATAQWFAEKHKAWIVSRGVNIPETIGRGATVSDVDWRKMSPAERISYARANRK